MFELALEAADECFAHELRRLAQQIQPGAVANSQRAVDSRRGGDSAQYEFRIQPIAALFQVAAIRHLSDQIRRTQEVPQLAILRIGELNHIELDLVTGEMDDARRHRHPGFEADARQVTREETRAAGHVIQGELGAIAVLAVIEFPNVARVMKQ